MSRKVKYNVKGGVFKPSEIADVLKMSVNKYSLYGNSKGVYYYNIPVAFDIETSSFYRDKHGKQYTYEEVKDRKDRFEKVANMYVWQLGINGNVIVGRTWQEFEEVCEYIVKTLELNENRRLIIYIHNLSYEFQFIRQRFEWERVFSIDLRKPIYAITKNFIEFRCSYLLSGYGLAKLGKQLLKYPVEKKTGDLDYHIIRHDKTPLTDAEIGYCVNDVRVVMSYIQEQIEELKSVSNIPLTKTGYVRKYCRKNCLYKPKANGKGREQNWRYFELMNELQINNLNEFNMLQRSFQGGFTHANGYYTDSVVENVSSFDFTSSYPYVMIAEQFPMSRGVKVKIKSQEQFNLYLEKYCCVFDAVFTNILASKTNDNPISKSKCWIAENVVENNGRVVGADRIGITLTNVDYEIIKQYYSWEKTQVGEMYCYRKGYLPTEFVKSILSLYEKKTTLKGIEGKESEYLNSKEMLNSCYGMCVTNPLRDEFIYNISHDWDIKELTEDEKGEFIYKYNTTRNRFLFYPWGIFITAYARKNLFTAITQCGNDYVYSDTDSVKICNVDRHKDYFDKYNKEVENKLKQACKHHNISFELCRPKTETGKVKLLGVWDYEGTYSRFKTLGAKRYMVEHKDALNVNGQSYDFSLTVSGVDKKCAIPYMVKTYGENIFDAFTDYLHLPSEGCGKNLHTYVDYKTEGTVTDYNGEVSEFCELSTVHLEPTDYNLSLSVMYLDYLIGRKLKDGLNYELPKRMRAKTTTPSLFDETINNNNTDDETDETGDCRHRQ